jgi:signal recognition particle receptor subunit beta
MVDVAKKRGITIELGFAHLDLPCGHRLGIVDVPGHEKFIRNMVAGAAGMDMVAFIVAADEGIMPQTREHFDICRMLGVQDGLIILTKNPTDEKIKIKTPTDEKAYRDLIVQFGNWSLAKADAAKDIASLEERLDVVAEQLKNSESNASDLLTLQLQYAFYLKGRDLYRQKLQRYGEAIARVPAAFVEGIKHIAFDTDAARKKIEKTDASLSKLEKEIQKLDVERERLNLLGKSGAVKRINDRINLLEAKKKNLLNAKLTELFVLFSAALHDKRSADAFALQKSIIKIVESFYPEEVQEDLALMSQRGISYLAFISVDPGQHRWGRLVLRIRRMELKVCALL